MWLILAIHKSASKTYSWDIVVKYLALACASLTAFSVVICNSRSILFFSLISFSSRRMTLILGQFTRYSVIYTYVTIFEVKQPERRGYNS